MQSANALINIDSILKKLTDSLKNFEISDHTKIANNIIPTDIKNNIKGKNKPRNYQNTKFNA